jgi:hypothetical protein
MPPSAAQLEQRDRLVDLALPLRGVRLAEKRLPERAAVAEDRASPAAVTASCGPAGTSVRPLRPELVDASWPFAAFLALLRSLRISDSVLSTEAAARLFAVEKFAKSPMSAVRRASYAPSAFLKVASLASAAGQHAQRGDQQLGGAAHLRPTIPQSHEPACGAQLELTGHASIDESPWTALGFQPSIDAPWKASRTSSMMLPAVASASEFWDATLDG